MSIKIDLVSLRQYIQSVTKHFGQNSKRIVRLQHNQPPAPPQCSMLCVEIPAQNVP
jgi:hypothetical protein